MSSIVSTYPQQPMHRRLAAWLLALAIALPAGLVWAAQSNDAAATQLLASELPSGVTLASANADQMVAAVRAAVKSEPKMTAGIVRVAIVTKVPASRRGRPGPRPRRPREGKDVSESGIVIPDSWRDGVFIAQVRRDRDYFDDPCDYASRILRAVMDVAPDRYREALEEAQRLLPDCDFGGGGGGGGGTPGGGVADGTGFGFGFGPGFVGSPPGGAVVGIPPTGGPVTNVTNP